MVDDASLTDFLDERNSTDESDRAPAGDEVDGNDAEPTESDAPDEGVPDGSDNRVPPSTVDPATSTAAWSPDGDACIVCDTVVHLRWESETGLVCPDCKEW